MRMLLLLLLASPAWATTVALTTGWNAVAFQHQRITSLTASEGVSAVAFFDGTYRTGPLTLETLNAGDAGRRGCWVYAARAATLTYEGQSDGRGDFLELQRGWNLVAFPGAGEVLGTSLAGASVLLNQVYDAGTGGAFDLTRGARLRPGRAYWVNASQAVRLTWPTAAAGRLPALWYEDGLVVLPGLTSSVTLPGFRLYHFIPGAIVSLFSADGLTGFSAPQSTGIVTLPNSQKERVKEFSVVRRASGRFFMLYEAVDRNNVSSFFRAESADGLTFSGPDTPVLQAEGAENGFISAPDLIEIDGVLYAYYVADQNKTFVASSRDGQTWTRLGPPTVRGFSGSMTDPDVLRRADGTLAFFFLHDGRGIGGSSQPVIQSASSTGDPLLFDVGPTVVLSQPGVLKVNPDAVELPTGGLRMYYALSRDNERSFDLYHADSQ